MQAFPIGMREKGPPISDFPLHFDRPGWLLLLLLLLPIVAVAWRSRGGLTRFKATVALGIRCILVILLAVGIARPTWETTGEGVTVTAVVDRSRSIPMPLQQHAQSVLKASTMVVDRAVDDRLAVIAVASEATPIVMPDRLAELQSIHDMPSPTQTNLAAGIRQAMAIKPDDTSNRILLVTDGNETVGNILAEGDLAIAAGVPIDVFLLEYEHENEVIFDRIAAPSRARPGQAVSLRLVLHTQKSTTGVIQLRQGGELVDLDPAAVGSGLHVLLPAGRHVIPVTLDLQTSGPQQFEAIFIPDDPASDTLTENNRAVAVTFVDSEGRILVIDDGSGVMASSIQEWQHAGLEVVSTTPAGQIGGLVQLAGFDAIVLANVPRWDFDDQQVRDLHAYVHDLGGGLIMVGGPQSLGAGGWIGSEVAKVLPVKLDPPQIRQMVRGALVLIMHSCEMPRGNFWGQRVGEAAIDALSRLDYAGIIEHNPGFTGAVSGAAWVYPLQIVSDKQAALDAIKQLRFGDMQDFDPSLKMTIQGLTAIDAGHKHVVIISDGDPQFTNQASILQQFIDQRISVSTVLVSPHTGGMAAAQMSTIAAKTGGTFYNVKNPMKLPQIFIKEAQVVSRSLIQEDGPYPISVERGAMGPMTGFGTVPSVDGYVLTADRGGLSQIPAVIPTQEGNDPLLAYWNYGLGRSMVFTSDLSSRWGAAWIQWPEVGAFWEQLVRWVMRSNSASNMTMQTTIEGETATVELEALGANASFMDFLSTRAWVLDPDSNRKALALQQVGPGRYRGQFTVDDPGAWLVNVNYSGADGVEGNIQAAVTLPYAAEFRTLSHSTPVMAELAARTGGRMMRQENGRLVDLFSREGLAVPISAAAIWDLLAIIAASVLIIDVAVRRLTIDPVWASETWRRWTRRDGEVTEGSVAALRRVKQRGSEDDRRFDADELGASSLDVSSEAQGGQSRPSMPAPTAKAPFAEDDLEGDDQEMTSQLLKARRKSRRPDQEGDE